MALNSAFVSSPRIRVAKLYSFPGSQQRPTSWKWPVSRVTISRYLQSRSTPKTSWPQLLSYELAGSRLVYRTKVIFSVGTRGARSSRLRICRSFFLRGRPSSCGLLCVPPTAFAYPGSLWQYPCVRCEIQNGESHCSVRTFRQGPLRKWGK